jgi:hypothetical protein
MHEISSAGKRSLLGHRPPTCCIRMLLQIFTPCAVCCAIRAVCMQNKQADKIGRHAQHFHLAMEEVRPQLI